MTKTDMQLKQDIEAELRWDPKVNAAQVGVSVDHGAVTLSGTVDTYAEKWAADDATKRVSGVMSVAYDLKVKVLADHARSDADIMAAAQTALRWDVFVPKTVIAKVKDGWVTLEGTATWNYQRYAAERSVGYLMGVLGVTNRVTLAPQVSATQVHEKVEAALLRQAKADGKSIHVEAMGGTVTLSGNASSWQSIEDASAAAWGAAGVTEVIDHMKIAMSP